jgi:hypothetical protein
MIAIKQIGQQSVTLNTSVFTGLKADITGTYVAQIFVGGSVTTENLAVTAGDDLKITNSFNECATVQFRIKRPTANLSGQSGYPANNANNYVTTPNGEVIFEYSNGL